MKRGGLDPWNRLTHDPILTEFEQLAASRLDAERSFLPLIDSDNQHIISAAMRSVSLCTKDTTNPDRIFPGLESWIWYGYLSKKDSNVHN